MDLYYKTFYGCSFCQIVMEQHAFKKCKQLFEYQHLLLLRDICGLYYKRVMIVIDAPSVVSK
jgi:hypothetical protein